MMIYFQLILLCCFISNACASSSVQNYVDNLLANIDNKVETIENNPALVSEIYRYFQKQYPRESSMRMAGLENAKRAEIFKSNLEYIVQHNANPLSTFTLKINEMSDWTDEERDARRMKVIDGPVNNNQPIKPIQRKVIPSQYDWTNQARIPAAVTSAKNQGKCGSCYAYAMVGVLEKTYAQLYKQSGSLSAQQLIDCIDEDGCAGRHFEETFSYITSNSHRLHLEKDYPPSPDRKQNGKCQKSDGVLLSFNKTASLRYQQLPTNNEEHMKQFLFEHGPLFVYFNVGQRTGDDAILKEVSTKFDQYDKKIFNVPGCPSRTNLNHALVVVGYGTENGVDYWRAKNSWGPEWGDNGYIRIKRNSNMCGIATRAYYAGIF